MGGNRPASKQPVGHMGRKVLPGADPFARGTAGGSLANRRGAAHSRVLCFSRRSRPSQLFDRRNGPEPSRARLLLARRSEPLTARTVLASGATRRAALAGKTGSSLFHVGSRVKSSLPAM